MIPRHPTFASPAEALAWLPDVYRRDRTEGQSWSVYVAVEKATMIEQLVAWFGGAGLPVLALSGYAPQFFVDEVAVEVRKRGRPAVLLYAGDHDPSGEDIDRDFVERAGCFAEVVRVALSWEQVVEHDLPPVPGKSTDSRASAFLERHGRLVQVELEALDPTVLRGLYEGALAPFVDESTFEQAVARERRERRQLSEIAERGQP